eukprot:TRINITY_DN15171_c0_g1_i3.p1 TRINITY_DN15171_c0_g1~~TRINITY_DN15171_c0_g1_i3.p1  ORF type:complete len:131 (-),score=26.73 TRINITY_DN15171_c0_g1_i3:93-485(-)
MIRRPPRSTLSSSSAASDVYKRQVIYQGFLRECTGLISIDLSPLSQVNTMHGMFLLGCTGIKVIDMRPLVTLGRIPLDLEEQCRVGNVELLLSLIHISEPTRLLSISYAVFCLKKKKQIKSKCNYGGDLE